MKNINALICSQATPARHKEALQHATNFSDQKEYRSMMENLHHKMDKYLLEDSEGNDAPLSFQEQLDGATDEVKQRFKVLS